MSQKIAGTDTNVLSNSVASCVSGGPDTNTVCQQGRAPFVYPNH
jgi:hypothetical protein